MTKLRLNIAGRDLVEHHEIDMVSAVNLCCRLESAKTWIECFGLVISRTRIPVGKVRAWLVKHSYMTERELGGAAAGEP